MFCIDTRYHDVWIVIPAFNEASVIGDVITDIRSVFDHVVCVDDGSKDDTGDLAPARAPVQLQGGRDSPIDVIHLFIFANFRRLWKG